MRSPIPLTHGVLVGRAIRWLSGTMRCDPVLSGIASTVEVPDAIGWCSRWKTYGSIVVECKTSGADLLRDKRKAVKPHMSQEQMLRALMRMGDFRYFLTPSGLVEPDYIQEHFVDHGLLHYDGHRVVVVREAKRRDKSDRESEVRLLRFALIHLHENLLRKGCTVNMCELTKHWAAERDGITFPEARQ